MVSTTKETGVVKLVHPGRHVEILKEPITASEVMNKNPRHCITRPDFFEFPWIVVKPESVLTPGRVYYIVPYRTIYDLGKADGHFNQPPSLRSRPSRHSRTRRTTSRHASSPATSSAGMTPKRRTKNRAFMPCVGSAHSPAEPGGCAPIRLKKRHYQVESCPEVATNDTDIYQEFRSLSMLETMMEKRAWQTCYEQSSSFDSVDEEESEVGVRVDGDSSAQSRALKSCLRKQDSVRKSLSLTVTFHLPSIVEKRKKQS